MKQGVAGHVMQLKTIFKMKLADFLVMIGLKLLVTGYLENTLRYTTPFNNSENSVMTQALLYLSFFMRKTTTLHVLYISLPSLHNYVVKCPNGNGKAIKCTYSL